MTNCRFPLLSVLVALALSHQARAQTLGVMKHTAASYDAGYVLIAPLNTTETYLIDKCGKLIHSWHSQYPPGLCTYLLPDGSILRSGSIDGGGQAGTSRVERITWDGQLVWNFLLETDNGVHHDIEPLPNGNVLVISHEPHTRAEMLALGRKSAITSTAPFLSEKIVELEPVGATGANVIWEWHPMDHLIQDADSTKPGFGNVAAHPELIDINFPNVAAGEWLHTNSVKYNHDLDQIVISHRTSSEIWIIDHSTSIAQAAGHTGGKYHKGGDLLYRWGCPEAYRHGTSATQTLFLQHDPWWVPAGFPHAGEMIIFNNGAGRTGSTLQYSSADRIVLPMDAQGNFSTANLPFLPATPTWTYFDTLPGEVMFSLVMGGVQMLRNGNMLISVSDKGTLTEVDSNGTKVWEYINPVTPSGALSQGDIPTGNQFFKARFYPGSYPAFAGRTLTPGAPLERNPSSSACVPNDTTIQPGVEWQAVLDNEIFISPNPITDHATLHGRVDRGSLVLCDVLGRKIVLADGGNVLGTTALPNGTYTLMGTSAGKPFVRLVSVMH